MKKLCIFDLDGTVLDTVPTIAHYGNAALVKNGLAPIPEKEYNYLAGRGIVSLVRGMMRTRGETDEALYESVFRDYDEAYNADPAHLTSVFRGLRPVLDEMRERGILLAVVSNKPDFAARSIIEQFYGHDYFFFVTGQREGVALKPDPSAVLSVLKTAGASPSDCLYIGDTSTDMETGRNAGIFTVGVLWGFRGREELLASGANAIVSTPAELLPLALDGTEGK